MLRSTRLAKALVGFKAPKLVNADGYIFENAKGGPYKYGRPLPATRENMQAAEIGLL